ncbi:hypothetical protein CC2G_006864 [Coprinopsis cinerea AmutBmut pab1-1]|nr:hypothetical protein CC2G_006864 [Coprinopsis cinerea AmutBmut pab1-1]
MPLTRCDSDSRRSDPCTGSGTLTKNHPTPDHHHSSLGLATRPASDVAPGATNCQRRSAKPTEEHLTISNTFTIQLFFVAMQGLNNSSKPRSGGSVMT